MMELQNAQAISKQSDAKAAEVRQESERHQELARRSEQLVEE
jgi:hypothetical protein